MRDLTYLICRSEVAGCLALDTIEEHKVEKRTYELPQDFAIRLSFPYFDMLVRASKGFWTDMRSGPCFLDFVVPHLGSRNERIGWLLHDIGSYDIGLTEDEDNQLLFTWLTQVCHYSNFKAGLVLKAVRAKRGWYGAPLPGDKWYRNNGKVSITFLPYGS